MKNGATEYKILVSEEGKVTHAEAINELQLFFEEATEIKLEVVTDEEVFSANAKYLSIGDTSLLQTADPCYSLHSPTLSLLPSAQVHKPVLYVCVSTASL